MGGPHSVSVGLHSVFPHPVSGGPHNVFQGLPAAYFRRRSRYPGKDKLCVVERFLQLFFFFFLLLGVVFCKEEDFPRVKDLIMHASFLDYYTFFIEIMAFLL